MRVALLKQLRACVPLLLFGIHAPLAAQSLTIPAASDVYRRLEAISALYPVRGLHLGQRPISRRELSRIVRQLGMAVDAAPYNASRREWARGQVAALAAALGRDSARALVSRLTLLASGSDARTERIEPNGLGLLDASTNPFSAGRNGWPTPAGAALNIAPVVALDAGSRIGVVVEPRFSAAANAGAAAGDLDLQRAYVRAVLSNVSVQVGTDEVLWGQSPLGALFISGNAAPLPSITIGSDTAFIMPWLFHLAGPIRATGFLADLGPTQDPPHARLVGWLVSIQPWARFELGVSVLVHTGGNGGPPATFIRRVVDLFPVIDALAPQHADLQFSNKVAGGNLRLRFPELSGLDVYYELAIDDFDGRRLVSSFVDDAGHLLGARIMAGPVVWRAEWHRTSLRLYEHSQFRSGLSYHAHLIGDPIGPNAKAGYLGGELQLSPVTRLDGVVADERRDPSQYTVTVSASRDRGFRFIRVTDDPTVRRTRGVLTLEHDLGDIAARLSAGYGRAWRTGSPARHEWIGQIALSTRLLPTF